MSEPEKSKRRWFQFHLSTAIALMLTTGAFVGLNLQRHISKQSWTYHFESSPGKAHTFELPTERFGWPITVVASVPTDYLRNLENCNELYVEDNGRFDTLALIGNAVVALTTLGGIALVSKFIIRRREARKA